MFIARFVEIRLSKCLKKRMFFVVFSFYCIEFRFEKEMRLLLFCRRNGSVDDMGKLVAIEGTDGSGKQTQSQLLHQYLSGKGIPCRLIRFPNYESESSSLVKMYLRGEFGTDANSVSPYAASVFFAGDRYASWKTIWESAYRGEELIITDRYVMSNLIHQASKLSSKEERIRFKNWLEDLEYGVFGLPKPSLVIYLHVDIECTIQLMKDRENKFTGESQKDIHETNLEYMRRSYECGRFFSQLDSWRKIECMNDGTLRDKAEICNDIVSLLKKECIL